MFKLSYLSSLPPLLALLTTAPLFTLAQNGVPSPDGAPMDMTSGAGGTYARANPLADGSLIGTYAGVTASNQKELRLVRSTDQGDSWSQIGVAASRPADESDLDNPYPLQLPEGRVLLAFRNHDRDPATGEYTAFRIDVTFSDDSGKSWEYLSTPASMPGGEVGIWEPLLRVADDDSLQIYYSKELATDNQDQIMRVSEDGGATWSEEMTIAGADILSRDGMTGVASLGGGNLVAVFESLQNGAFQLDAIDSPDDGATWQNRRTIYTAQGENNNAGAPQIVNVGGTLVVSFMTDEDTQLHDWINGAGAKLITSTDGGATWGNKIQVFEPQAEWPGMVALDDGSFLYMANKDGAKSQRITLS